ncbi:MAG TPA: hypothetical protein VEC01_03560 [Noviherbaspirillum sp.]|uniref:hypothetical protein n=1 Tax=Noviherbaspirillum sp. TaxID=1926288 RepID=UPI002D43F18B|nr:hypothetical protein [Noviherbaspirillum sp.]HYD94379.1 hypothetical protein [Noviherbaspirillum sp.]
MTSSHLVRLAGAALVASGILVTLGFSTHPHDALGANRLLWVGSHAIILLGFAAGLLGLCGLYGVAAPATGGAALAGFLLAQASLILYLGKLYWSGFIYPLVAARHPDFIAQSGFNPGAQPVDPVLKAVFYLGPLLFGAGYALLGRELLKARLFPAPPVWLVIAGAALVGLWPLLPGAVQQFSVIVSLVFTAGIAWLGWLLVADKHRAGVHALASKETP